MLSRAGGVAYQKVVGTVADLPSPLDAHPGDSYIVRETEEVYQFDHETRTWQVVGTLKRVGGKRPAEIAAHIDSVENPHRVSVDQAYRNGGGVTIDEECGELVLEAGKGLTKALLALHAQNGRALRIGKQVGDSKALLWINPGKARGNTAILRVVDEGTGGDRLLLDDAGNLWSTGAATFAGGLKGPVTAHDALTATKGLFGADAPEGTADADAKSLELGSGRARGEGAPGEIRFLLSKAGAKGKLGDRACRAVLTERGLGIGTVAPTEALDVFGNLKLSGTVSADLRPTGSGQFILGDALHRWKSVAAKSLDVEAGDAPALRVKASADPRPALLLVTRKEDGDLLSLDGSGRLGLGTGTPERTLDVRGSGLAIGAPADGARVALADLGHGHVVLGFNLRLDGNPENADLHCWSTSFGDARNDAFEVRRRAKGAGAWKSLLRINDDGVQTDASLRVGGLLEADAGVVTNALLSRHSSGAGLHLGEVFAYKALAPLKSGAAHHFQGVWSAPERALLGLLLDIEDRGSSDVASLLQLRIGGRTAFDVRKSGDVFSHGNLGSANAPWWSAYLASALNVGSTLYGDNGIKAKEFVVRTDSKALGVEESVSFDGARSAILPSSTTGVLEIEGKGRKILLNTTKDGYGLYFPEGGASLSGVTGLTVERKRRTKSAPMLRLEQTWANKSEQFEALLVDVEDQGSARDSVLAAFAVNGRDVLALFKDELALAGALNLNGLRHESLEETLDLTGQTQAVTSFKIPAGVRVEAVVATVVDEIQGAHYMRLGDGTLPDRFAGASTALTKGAVVRALDHCDRGQAVQRAEDPVVVTLDVPATAGKLHVKVHYLDPASGA